jgi:hypothetical protein
VPDFGESYNVAPQSFQPVIRLNRDTGQREIVLMRWGLIPYWILLANSGGAAEVFRKGDFAGARAIQLASAMIWTGETFRFTISALPSGGFRLDNRYSGTCHENVTGAGVWPSVEKAREIAETTARHLLAGASVTWNVE